MRDITINTILKMIVAHIKLIIIVSVCTALCAYIYADNFIPKKYSSTALICVKYGTADVTMDTDNKMSAGTVSPSTILAENCSIIFRYSEEMRSVIPPGYGVSIASISESNVLSITVVGGEAVKCAETANAIREKAPEVFDTYYADGEVIPLGSDAGIPSRHSSPNETRYAFLGFIVGLIVSVLISIIVEIVDTTIKPTDDLFKMYEVPVFAEIVDFDSDGAAKKRGGVKRA